MSEAREENPLVVEMLSSSCCELLSLISFTRENPDVEAPPALTKGLPKGPAAEVEAPARGKGLPKGPPAAEDVEGWGKRELEPPRPSPAEATAELSREAKWRWERLRGGRDSTSLKFSDARLVEGSGNFRKVILPIEWTALSLFNNRFCLFFLT